ncbi:MAG: transporter [Acidobacteria bacterium]|nr:transporter [Acidobacteriota bacterium]
MKRLLLHSSVLAALLAMAATAAAAQEAEAPVFSPDRPGSVDTREVVGRSVVEIESGLSRVSLSDGETALTAPQMLVRVGVGNRLELRAGGDGFVFGAEAPGARPTASRADTFVGAKLTLFAHEHAGIQVAVLPSLTMPTGGDGLSAHRWNPGVRVAFGRELPADLDLAATLGVARHSDAHDAVTQRSASVGLSRRLSSAISGFLETTVASSIGEGREWEYEGGIAARVGANVQLDAALLRGITAAAPDWGVSVGLVVRRLPAGRH